MFLFCQGVPLDVIYEMFKFAYCMFWLEVEPADSGHGGVSRPRIYIFLSLLETGTVLHDPCVLYAQLRDELKKRISTTPQDYWLATEDEIALESMELAAKRKIPFQMEAWPCLEGFRASFESQSSTTHTHDIHTHSHTHEQRYTTINIDTIRFIHTCTDPCLTLRTKRT